MAGMQGELSMHVVVALRSTGIILERTRITHLAAIEALIQAYAPFLTTYRR